VTGFAIFLAVIFSVVCGVLAARGNVEANRPYWTGFAWGFVLTWIGVAVSQWAVTYWTGFGLLYLLGWVGVAHTSWRDEKLTPEGEALFKALDEHRARRLGLAQEVSGTARRSPSRGRSLVTDDV
jgi:hypothetical protein